MALTTQQQQQVAAYFASNVYGAMSQTATNGSDVLASAVGAIDIAIAVSPTATNASVSIAATITGRFTIVQAEILLAYTLLKRAGAI